MLVSPVASVELILNHITANIPSKITHLPHIVSFQDPSLALALEPVFSQLGISTITNTRFQNEFGRHLMLHMEAAAVYLQQEDSDGNRQGPSVHSWIMRHTPSLPGVTGGM